jgi:hypothetical protein
VTIPGIEITTNNINRIHILGVWGFVLTDKGFDIRPPDIGPECWSAFAARTHTGFRNCKANYWSAGIPL